MSPLSTQKIKGSLRFLGPLNVMRLRFYSRWFETSPREYFYSPNWVFVFNATLFDRESLLGPLIQPRIRRLPTTSKEVLAHRFTPQLSYFISSEEFSSFNMGDLYFDKEDLMNFLRIFASAGIVYGGIVLLKPSTNFITKLVFYINLLTIYIYHDLELGVLLSWLNSLYRRGLRKTRMLLFFTSSIPYRFFFTTGSLLQKLAYKSLFAITYTILFSRLIIKQVVIGLFITLIRSSIIKNKVLSNGNYLMLLLLLISSAGSIGWSIYSLGLGSPFYIDLISNFISVVHQKTSFLTPSGTGLYITPVGQTTTDSTSTLLDYVPSIYSSILSLQSDLIGLSHYYPNLFVGDKVQGTICFSFLSPSLSEAQCTVEGLLKTLHTFSGGYSTIDKSISFIENTDPLLVNKVVCKVKLENFTQLRDYKEVTNNPVLSWENPYPNNVTDKFHTLASLNHYKLEIASAHHKLTDLKFPLIRITSSFDLIVCFSNIRIEIEPRAFLSYFTPFFFDDDFDFDESMDDFIEEFAENYIHNIISTIKGADPDSPDFSLDAYNTRRDYYRLVLEQFHPHWYDFEHDIYKSRPSTGWITDIGGGEPERFFNYGHYKRSLGYDTYPNVRIRNLATFFGHRLKL